MYLRILILSALSLFIFSCKNLQNDSSNEKTKKGEQNKEIVKKPAAEKSEKEIETKAPSKKKVESKRPKPKPESETSYNENQRKPVSSISAAELRSGFIKAVNAERAKGCMCGNRKFAPALPVKWSSSLESIAKSHSVDMAKQQRMSHTGSNGSDVPGRLDAGGYSWMAYTENVAAGHRSIQQVMEGWMNSPGHCKNIMNPNCNEMGVAEASNYWTMLLAAPRKVVQ